MKILHISMVGVLGNGLRKQLEAEYNSSINNTNVEWNTLVYHIGKPLNEFERKIPKFFTPILIRQLYIWIILVYKSKEYDIILQRKFTFDIFGMLFGYFVKNRYTVHHSKEIEELRLIKSGFTGKLVSFAEKISGYVNARQIKGFIGVTNEIAYYENKINNTNKPIYIYPNGIESCKIKLLDDNREESFNFAFMCNTFTKWHGLDILLNEIKLRYNDIDNLKIHLIGELKSFQKKSIERFDSKRIFEIYGRLEQKKYQHILSKCDIGIGSLGMHRQNLNEGSTLKVREYLASGLPVYSNHKDVSLENDFQFYYFDKEIRIRNMISFSSDMKKFERKIVRKLSIPFIEKNVLMNNLITNLRKE